jgi:MFS family permease
MRLFGIVVCLQMLVAVVSTHIVGLYVSYFLMGFGHQMMVMSIIHFLSLKYKKEMVKYVGYVFTGSAVAIVWGFVFSVLVNPNNKEKSVRLVLPNGDEELTFPRDVSRRFPYLCVVYAISNLIISLVVSCFIYDSSSDIEEPFDFHNEDDSDFININKLSFYSSHGLLGLSDEIISR